MGGGGREKTIGLSPPSGQGGGGVALRHMVPFQMPLASGAREVLSIAEGQYCLPTNPWKGDHLLLIYPMAISHLFHNLEGETEGPGVTYWILKGSHHFVISPGLFI